MSLDGSDYLNKANVNIYAERITLHEKMRTKLTLEQKRWVLDVIGRLNYYFTTKAVDFYRYDVFSACIQYRDKKGFELKFKTIKSCFKCPKLFFFSYDFPTPTDHSVRSP